MEHPKLRAFVYFMWKKRTLYVSLGMLIAFALVFIVLATPLRVLLPGYMDVEMRTTMMGSALRIDSLERENDLRMAYLNNVTAILSDRVKIDSLQAYDSVVPRIQDTLMTASERETYFMDNYESRERFGLESLENIKSPHQAVVFLAPVKGKFALSDTRRKEEVRVSRIEVSGQVPVMAPLEGTVVSSVFVMGEGYEILLQHSQDYLTRFTHLKTVNVEVGQVLKPGAVMAMVGDKEDPVSCWMGLQVWHKGKCIDPASVIPIE